MRCRARIIRATAIRPTKRWKSSSHRSNRAPGALACSSGMAALNLAIMAALLDRRRVILAASALYGATINMLTKVLEPSGIETVFVDFNDETATAAAIAEHRPGALLMETISNPLLRVAPLDRIAAMAKEAGAQLIVDSTFATPLMIRPLELGATFVVHSLTKYLSGHGDVLGGIVVTDSANIEAVRSSGAVARTIAWARSNRTSPCAASRRFPCAWSASAPMPAGSRAGSRRIRPSTASISRRTRRIPMPPS